MNRWYSEGSVNPPDQPPDSPEPEYVPISDGLLEVLSREVGDFVEQLLLDNGAAEVEAEHAGIIAASDFRIHVRDADIEVESKPQEPELEDDE